MKNFVRIKKSNRKTLATLTLGKEYLAYDTKPSTSFGKSFHIVSDSGTQIYCLLDNCAHLGGGSWEFVDSPNSKKVLGFKDIFRRFVNLFKG